MKVFVKNSKVLTTGGKPIKVPEWGPAAKSAGITRLRTFTGGPASVNCNDFTIGGKAVILSSDINDYQEVQYVEATGTQCVNTGYIPKSNTKIVFDGVVVSNADRNWEALFGARYESYNYNAYVFFTRCSPSGSAVNSPIYCRTGAETLGSNMIYDTRITLQTYNTIATWTDGTDTYSLTTTGTINDCVNPLLIFDLNTSGGSGVKEDGSKSRAKLYSFKIYEDDLLIKDYMPCYHIDSGLIGLFEKVNNNFLIASNLLKGPDVN